MHWGRVGHNPTRLPIHPWMGADGVARRRRCCWDRAVELVIGIEGLVSVVDEGFAHLSVAIMRGLSLLPGPAEGLCDLAPPFARALAIEDSSSSFSRGFVLIFSEGSSSYCSRIRPHFSRGFVLIFSHEDSSSISFSASLQLFVRGFVLMPCQRIRPRSASVASASLQLLSEDSSFGRAALAMRATRGFVLIAVFEASASQIQCPFAALRIRPRHGLRPRPHIVVCKAFGPGCGGMMVHCRSLQLGCPSNLDCDSS